MRRKTEKLNLYLKSKEMSTEIEGIKFYTIPETAKALRVTPQTVRALSLIHISEPTRPY